MLNKTSGNTNLNINACLTQGMKSLTPDSFFGLFSGVSFSLVSVKFTEAGMASTLMTMVPIFIIAPAVILYKENVTLAEIIGAVLSVGCVALFFM
jgi:drug/metabolite transporter (DMT)-like permease